MESDFDFWDTMDVQDEIVKSSKEIEDPILLFRQFVSAVTSDALEDIQLLSEVSRGLFCLFRKS
jgi:hypothetical protein